MAGRRAPLSLSGLLLAIAGTNHGLVMGAFTFRSADTSAEGHRPAGRAPGSGAIQPAPSQPASIGPASRVDVVDR